MKKIFTNFGPALLAIAMGIGSGEFILWPFMTANYGFGIMWGALLGISLQLFLIIIIQKQTVLLEKNIIKIFSMVFSSAALWIVVSTILGFGWPGFASTASSLLVDGFNFNQTLFLPISILIIVLASGILIFSNYSQTGAYKNILKIQKVNMLFLLFLALFLFFWYFDWQIFGEMILGFLGYSKDYLFIPAGISLASFFGAIAYAGSGGNLLLANSFYTQEENQKLQERPVTLKTLFWQNFIFFFITGLLIIILLSYISYASLQGSTLHTSVSDFSFLIQEARIFSADIFSAVGYLFILSGVFALFGVQLGIFDFIGRISKAAKYSYSYSILITAIAGILILFSGIQQPKTLIITGAIINAFSMGIIALLLFLVEKNILPKKHKKTKISIALIFVSLCYFSFFIYVVFEKIFL